MPASELTLVMPAESRFVSTARVTAASLAAELDFSIDEIEELRMGANELVVILSELANDNGITTLELRYVVGDGVIEIHGRVPAVGDIDGAEADVLACQILDAVVDSYSFEGPAAHIVKRRADG